MQNPSGERNIRQRITEGQMDVITKHFCTIIDKYYQSVIIYRKRYEERIQRQYELSLKKCL